MGSRRSDPDRIKRGQMLERKAKAKQALRWGGYSALALVVVAGAAFAVINMPEGPASVHWHALYQVWLEDEEVSFANPAYSGMAYGAAHLHAPAYNKIHNEGKEGRGTLGRFFQFTVDSSLSDDRLVLSPGTSHPGTYVEEGDKQLRLFMDNALKNTTWTEVLGGFADISFRDGDRYLFVYGNHTDEQIQMLQERFPPFNPGEREEGSSPIIEGARVEDRR